MGEKNGEEIEKVGERAEDYGLNEKQKRFCEYYIKNQSAGQAYYRAYATDMNKEISMGSAYTNGAKLLKSDKIKNYLNVLHKETKKRNLMEMEEIISELVDIATTPATKTSDKLRALELIGKYHGGWQDKVTVDQTSTIEINLTGIETIPMKVIDSVPTYLISDGENGND